MRKHTQKIWSWWGLVAMLAGLLGQAAVGQAWSHQGHILVTRLAVLRILEDPAAPEELKAFLQTHMKATRADCQSLATGVSVGPTARDFLVGLDGACTWPDRIQDTPEGKVILEPYGVAEGKMHFLDLEFFAKQPMYQDDLSNKPALADIPREVKDPRFKQAGFLPFRVLESYGCLVASLGAKGRPVNQAEAVKWLGYLVHYVEDSTQPHHGTVDYKSLSYLGEKVEGVLISENKNADGSPRYYVPKGTAINPHGDVEFQLFENAEEPRRTLRAKFWQKLQADLEKLPQEAGAPTGPGGDLFQQTLINLRQGYDHLPLIGHGAQAAYAKGRFDCQAFFEYHEAGSKVTVLDMIARQHARAVLQAERVIRQAWQEAKAKE